MIALIEYVMIGNKVFEIGVAELRNHTVQKTPPAVGRAIDQLLVLGRNHDKGNTAYVFREAIVFFLVGLQNFAPAAFIGAMNLKGSIFVPIRTVYGKEIVAVPNVLLINAVKITLGKRQVVNGVEQIGFAAAVVAHKAVNLRTKFQFQFPVILKRG